MIVIYNASIMDIRGLEVFLSVAKHFNYTRAGEEVNLSQPSVSIRIKQLENELGMKVVRQLGKKVALSGFAICDIDCHLTLLLMSAKYHLCNRHRRA